MRIAAAVAVVSLLMTRPPHLSARDLLTDVRPLTGPEIAAVLDASQRAIAGKTFRLVPGKLAEGPHILMGRAGMPRRIRWAGAILGGTVSGLASGSGEARPSTTTTWRQDFVIITDYIGRGVRRCNWSEEDELVVDYRLDPPGSAWQIVVRRRDARDFGGIGIAPIFRMLQGAVTLASGELKRIDGRRARALTSVWIPPGRSEDPPLLIGDPIPNMRGEPVAPVEGKAVQSLWIDARTLRPLRWEVSEGGLRLFSFDFKYSSFKIPLPPNVHPPDCLR